MRSKKKESFENQYWELVKAPPLFLTERETLEQPHLYKFVDSITTYGAYQKPI